MKSIPQKELIQKTLEAVDKMIEILQNLTFEKAVGGTGFLGWTFRSIATSPKQREVFDNKRQVAKGGLEDIKKECQTMLTLESSEDVFFAAYKKILLDYDLLRSTLVQEFISTIPPIVQGSELAQLLQALQSNAIPKMLLAIAQDETALDRTNPHVKGKFDDVVKKYGSLALAEPQPGLRM